jgi:plasmid stabilization system protein ParE
VAPVRVVVSPEARNDLAETRRYYRRVAGPAVAARMTSRLRNAIAAIGDAPLALSPRPEFGADVRIRVCLPYVI